MCPQVSVNRTSGLVGCKDIPVFFIREKKYFIAYTPVLDISTSGKTRKIAKKRFTELVELFFEELVEMDTVDEVLESMGWEKVKKEWTPPQVEIDATPFSIRVPVAA